MATRLLACRRAEHRYPVTEDKSGIDWGFYYSRLIFNDRKMIVNNVPHRWNYVFIVVVGLIWATSQSVAQVMPLGLEPERISHYDPDAIPAGVRKDLPPITDSDGKRDAFFYPDGLLKGACCTYEISAELRP